MPEKIGEEKEGAGESFRPKYEFNDHLSSAQLKSAPNRAENVNDSREANVTANVTK